MTPQFVDFNADGHVDIVTGTFDGSPHVAFGTEGGFQQPQRLKDRDGNRIVLTEFWNYETEEWDNTNRAFDADSEEGEWHGTSAVAYDWDADGDFDLLLGDKNQGRLFRQMNEGTNAKPQFTGKNIDVMAAGRPFDLEGGITSPYVVDWDRDGLQDLVCGSFGDSYGDGAGGGVYLFRNVGREGSPEFAAAKILVAPSPKTDPQPTCPNSGLYVDVTDYNQDGHLDLLVGGYSQWEPEGQKLTDEQLQTVAELEARQKEVLDELRARQASALESDQELTIEQQQERVSALYESDDYLKLISDYTDVGQQLQELQPGPKREAFVWLYTQKKPR